MKTTQSSLTLALATACVSSAFAQVATPPNSGLLGKRHVEASFIVTDTQNMSQTGYGLGTAVNLPLTSKLDAGASFTHNWAEGGRSRE